MTMIYLVRHGQASLGAESYDQLSTLGKQQAQLLGANLQSILKEFPQVFSGTMQRHQQTAQIALQDFSQVDIAVDALWNEFDHQQVFARFDPSFLQPEQFRQKILEQEHPQTYLKQFFRGAIQRWISGQFDDDYEESWPQFQARVIQAFEQLCLQPWQEQSRYAVVFTSGGVISVIIGHLLGLNAEKIFELNWSLANASITSIRLRANQPQLISFNEHLYIKAVNAKLMSWV